MTARAEGAASRVRLVAALLIVGMAAGPAAEHLYWMLGGTWALEATSGGRAEATTGVRAVAAIVFVLLVLAILVVLARVGFWQPAFVSERAIRIFAWVLAAAWLVEALGGFVNFGLARTDWEQFGYCLGALVFGLLALVVAGSGRAWPRFHRPHRTLSAH
jgi:hypothetical protein